MRKVLVTAAMVLCAALPVAACQSGSSGSSGGSSQPAAAASADANQAKAALTKFEATPQGKKVVADVKAAGDKCVPAHSYLLVKKSVRQATEKCLGAIVPKAQRAAFFSYAWSRIVPDKAWKKANRPVFINDLLNWVVKNVKVAS